MEDLVATSKSDLKKGAIRGSARRLTSETRDMINFALKQANLSPAMERKMLKWINTPEGFGLISIAMGLVSKYTPGLKDSEIAQEFSEEFRVEGVATEFGAGLDRFSSSFFFMLMGRANAIKDAIKGMEGKFTEDLIANNPRARVVADAPVKKRAPAKISPIQPGASQNDVEAEDDAAEVEAAQAQPQAARAG